MPRTNIVKHKPASSTTSAGSGWKPACVECGRRGQFTLRDLNHCSNCFDAVCAREGLSAEKVNNGKQRCLQCKDVRKGYGFPGETPTLCYDCKLPGMVDLNNPKCVQCHKTQPNYGFPENDKAIYCGTCKVEGSVRFKACVCCEEVEGKQDKKPRAKYALPGEILPKYCEEHKKEGCRNVFDIRCSDCKTAFATVGLPGKPITMCVNCRTDHIASKVKYVPHTNPSYPDVPSRETAHLVFKTIPRFPKNIVCADGNIYSAREFNLKPLKLSEAKQVGMYNEEEKKVSKILPHRAVVEAFYPDLFDGDLTVDHMNAINTDNWVGNLQAILSSENVRRSHQSTPRVGPCPKAVIATCLVKPLVREYPSAFAAASDLKISLDIVRHCLRGSQTSSGGWKFKYVLAPDLSGEQWATSPALVALLTSKGLSLPSAEKMRVSSEGRIWTTRGLKTFGRVRGDKYRGFYNFLVHRLVWIGFKGHIAPGKVIMHSDVEPLDNEGCKKNCLRFLNIGSQKDNINAMVAQLKSSNRIHGNVSGGVCAVKVGGHRSFKSQGAAAKDTKFSRSSIRSSMDTGRAAKKTQGWIFYKAAECPACNSK